MNKRITCVNCGKILSNQDNFCPYCGVYQKAVCSVCGKKIKEVKTADTICICGRKCGVILLAKLCKQVRENRKRFASAETDTNQHEPKSII